MSRRSSDDLTLRQEIGLRVLLWAILTPVAKGVAALVGLSIAWWLAALIAFVLVAGGSLVIIIFDGEGLGS